MKQFISVTSLLIAVMAIFFVPPVNATFSIVAVDTATGEVGGAGASCIDNCQIINDLVADVGAIHTQAYWIIDNKNNARNKLAEGLTPDSIIGWLINNDVEGAPEYRQYGVVTLADDGASAAYTGAYTNYWKGHITGPGYAIQGNILIGEYVLTYMELAFNNTEGPLEDRLMAALQAANITGADNRCYNYDKPAISAFIHVKKPGETDTSYLYLEVTDTDPSENPIDSLQILYDLWKETKYANADLSGVSLDPVGLLAGSGDSALLTVTPLNYEGNPPADGITEIAISNTGGGIPGDFIDNGDGTFSAYVIEPGYNGEDTLSVFVTAGGTQTELTDHPILEYYICGDATGGFSINLLDITMLIGCLYQDGSCPIPEARADVDNTGSLNLLDITYLISYLYKEGPAPVCQ